MNNNKLPHLTGPSKSGYYRFQANMSKAVAQKVSVVLGKIKARFPKANMSLAWCEAAFTLDDLWTAQAKIDHALEIIRRNHRPGDVADDVLKSLTGCPTGTRVEFIGVSEEYQKFWEQGEGEN